ncbi:MAG: insulinase family protein [Vicinamibacterales bacterium]
MIAVTLEVRTGRLSNGLQSFIRANGTPKGHAELRLVVNAGSVLEDTEHRGLAHFVEHMAFNGTTNFPGDEIPTSSSASACGSVRTSTHTPASTKRSTSCRSHRRSAHHRPLDARRSSRTRAHNVTFDRAEVEERGVVLEEWRLGLGAEWRIRDAQMPVLLKGARYADRSPIGRPEILQNVAPERLHQVSSNWSTSDMMAVMRISDFNPAMLEQMVFARSNGVPHAVNPKPRPLYPSRAPDTLYWLMTDREARGTMVNVSA